MTIINIEKTKYFFSIAYGFCFIFDLFLCFCISFLSILEGSLVSSPINGQSAGIPKFPEKGGTRDKKKTLRRGSSVGAPGFRESPEKGGTRDKIKTLW